ncbi:MAG: tyrosine-type recombinase/integrase [Streptosporangiaceae bacterium]
MRSAPMTFARRADAVRWLALKEAEIKRGDWIDPDRGSVVFGDYAEQWIQDRVLKVRTADLYRALLRNHLLPTFGQVRLADIDEAAIRRWRKERLSAGPVASRPFGPVTVAKAYRLLHAIFVTACDDDRLVRRNPCRIEGAGVEHSPEREIASLPVVFAVADALPVRYRAMVLLATFAGLRWGELAGLRRENIDLEAREIRIVETTAELDKGGLLPETPKSRAGRRTVAFPAELVPELRWHLERFAEPGERGLVFVGPKGGPLRRSNFRPIWHAARSKAGAPGLHFHDLRHVGGTLAAATGASMKELMARLGHSSTRAALIYQHASRDRDQAIANALGSLMQRAREQPSESRQDA